MPSNADLDAVFTGLLGAGENIANRYQRQHSTQFAAEGLDLKTRMAELDEARQRIDLARRQAKFELEDREKERAETAARKAALDRIRGQGPLGAKLADLLESQQAQPSGDVQKAFLGIEDRPTAGGDTRANYEYALKQGYRGSLVDFIKETKTTTRSGTAPKPPMTIVQARTAVKDKVKEKIKDLEAQENEWISEEAWRHLSADEKKQFHGPVLEGADQGTPYYRPRTDVQDSLKQLKAYLKDEAAIKRGADSLLQVWGGQPGQGVNPDSVAHPEWFMPAEWPDVGGDVSKFTPERAYDSLKQMGVTGLEGVDPTDPENVDLLRYYLENPDAFNK